MRHFDPGKRLVGEFSPTQPNLPIDKLIVQYIRQSTPVQVKKNKQSAILQDAKLTRRLIAYGWPDERIIKIDTDQGKSGQKRRDERAGLDKLYRLVLSGKAGAVAAYDADRLYRDLTHVHYADFVNMCETHNIIVITYDTIYWPHIRRDMDALIEKFAEAAHFIDEVIHGKLIPAKMQAIEESQSYGGHSVPIGFYVAEDKLEERKYYVVYEPHAKIVRWLFKRYRELCGNLGKLGREGRAMNLTFPPFTGLETIPHVALGWNGEGYPLRTRGSLISILTNPAYIGYYIYNGVLISKKAHDAIVDMDDFLYAYSRLSPVTLDGQENTAKPKLDRRHGVTCDALLENLLENDGAPVYVMADNQTYTAKIHNDGWKITPLAVPVPLVDKEFSIALRLLLMTGYIYRPHGKQNRWMPSETDAIRRLYPAASRLDIMKAIPLRSWPSIVQQAHFQRVTRDRGLDTDNIDETLCYADMELMERERIDKDSFPAPGVTYPTSRWRWQELPKDGKQEGLSPGQGNR